jgi:molybdate transport system substrate-binding protein
MITRIEVSMPTRLVLIAAVVFMATVQAKNQSAPTVFTVLSSNGFQAALEELAPRFERDKKQKLNVTYDLAATLKQRIENGLAFDLAVLTPAAIDDLIKSGKIAAASRTPLARVGLGLAVRAGARKPDLATTDAFKRTLTNAKSITYVKEGASGVAFVGLIERIGLAAALQPKTRLAATRDEVGEILARGDAELGVLPVSEILTLRGVELGGRFPADVQTYIVMVAGASTTSAQSPSVQDLIKFLLDAHSGSVMSAKGMERVK